MYVTENEENIKSKRKKIAQSHCTEKKIQAVLAFVRDCIT